MSAIHATRTRTLAALIFAVLLPVAAHSAPRAAAAKPLVIGDTFTIRSKVLGEHRRINVYRPTVYGEAQDAPLPVLYMPDGGLGEDFLHIAGLVQILVSDGVIRPFLVVGIENTERRRDLTGPTSNAEDRKIAPRVGGSAAFRQFIRNELMPEVRRRYRTTRETALIGESLAGLFAVETLFVEPDLFDTYIAIDPSLWWNDAALIKDAAKRLHERALAKTLYLTNSDEPTIAADTQRLATILSADAPPALRWRYEPMPDEHHSTIYHPAAMRAFRSIFAPAKATP